MSLALLADQLVELQTESDFNTAFTLEGMADGHLKQLEYMRACQTERRVLIQCARQVGKSWGILGAMLFRAVYTPGTTSVFFGLNGVAVRSNAWDAVWKPLLHRNGIQATHNESRMLTTFANGSRVHFTGTDDLTHVANILGNRFKGAILAIDEMQSQKTTAIKALLGHILPPTMTPETTLILAGTIPEVPGGIWHEEGQKDSYAQFGWGRVELTQPMPEGLTAEEEYAHLEKHLVSVNPHTPEAPQVLIQHLRDNKLPISDSTIQRDWFGNRNAFDPSARTYFYRAAVNAYPAETPVFAKDLSVPSGEFVCAVPMPGITAFYGSIDPGASDPCGVEVWGFDPTGRNPILQQVFSWQSKRDHRLPMSALMAVASFANKHYRTQFWSLDSGHKQDSDHLSHDYGMPVISAVNRGPMDGSIRRLNDHLSNGTVKVIDDPRNPLIVDFQNAQLDPDGLARGQHKWRSTYHPTSSELARYIVDAWWAAKPPATKKPKPQLDPFELEEQQRAYKEKYGRKPRK